MKNHLFPIDFSENNTYTIIKKIKYHINFV